MNEIWAKIISVVKKDGLPSKFKFNPMISHPDYLQFIKECNNQLYKYNHHTKLYSHKYRIKQIANENLNPPSEFHYDKKTKIARINLFNNSMSFANAL